MKFSIPLLKLAVITLLVTPVVLLAQRPSDVVGQSLRLRSGTELTSERAFLVDQDALRRISTVLERASQTSKIPCALIYTVFRKDKRYYETTSIDEVLADPNLRDKRITTLRLELRVTDAKLLADPRRYDKIAWVNFDMNHPTDIKTFVSGEDKSWSLDLSDQLEPQVARTFNDSGTPVWLIAIAALVLVALAYRAKTFLPDSSMVRQVSDILLNYLTFSMLFGLTIGTYKTWRGSDQFVMLFGPTSGFLWGDFGKTLQDWASLQNNVFWAVVVGLVVSLVANTLPSLVKGSKKSQATKDPDPEGPPAGGV